MAAAVKKKAGAAKQPPAAEVEIISPETDAKTAPKDESGGTVCVALNRPHGLKFDLGGGRSVRLNGNAANLKGKPQGHLPAGAYGLTVVPARDWEEVMAKYGRMAVFRKGLCFAHEKKADTVAEAREKAGLRHGREAADPKKGTTEPASAPVE